MSAECRECGELTWRCAGCGDTCDTADVFHEEEGAPADWVHLIYSEADDTGDICGPVWPSCGASHDSDLCEKGGPEL